MCHKEYHELYSAVLGCVGVNVKALFNWWGSHCFVRQRERNPQDATNLMLIVKLLSQHV